MKSALKLSIIICLLLTVYSLNAQIYRVEIGYGKPSRYGAESRTTHFDGIRLGATAEFKLKDNFSLLTGALYNAVYAKEVQYYSPSDSVTYRTFGHSVDIPLRLTYTLNISKTMKAFAFAGPNINIGLFQPQKISTVLTTSLAEYTNIKDLDYSENDLYKRALISRINFQIGAGAGLQWKNYQIKGGYDFGINSINKIDTSKLFQSGWYVSLVYQF
jgi:hypothetical protein